MTILFSDSFNGRTSTTTLGTSDSYAGGTNIAWTVLGSAVYGVDANGYAYCAKVASSGHGIAYVDTGNNSGSITATIAQTTTSDYPKIAFRVVDGENFHFVEHDKASNQLVLRKYVSGSGSTIASKTSAGLSTTNDVIKITSNGTAITVFLNGVQVISATDSTNQTATKWGFNAYNYTGAKFDNIIVEDLNTGPVGTDGSSAFDLKQILYSDASMLIDSKQTLYTDSFATIDTKQAFYSDGTLNGDSKQSLFADSAVNFDLKQSLYSDSFTAFDSLQTIYNDSETGYDTKLVIYQDGLFAFDTLQEIMDGMNGNTSFDVKAVLFRDDLTIFDTIQKNYQDGTVEIDLLQVITPKVSVWRVEVKQTVNKWTSAEPPETNWTTPEKQARTFR